MTELEEDLFGEMVRSIKLLGAKQELLNILNTINSSLPQGENTQETLTLVRCWNDQVEQVLKGNIPENEIYKRTEISICS